MSSQTVVGAEAQQRVPLFADKNEAERKSKPVASKNESVAANEPDEFEIRRRQFFAGTKNAS